MAIDNRTLLNDASAPFTGGNDVGSVTTLAGLFYETSALSVQFTNTDERTFTTNIGGPLDLSDATCYMIAKDNLMQTQALGGTKYVLYDGTDEIGYEIGGNDNVGIPLTPFFNGFKLDVSNSAAFTAHVFAGSEATLTKTAITGIGYGTNHLAKAQGSIDNCFLDQFFFISNGSPALTVNSGTVGSPINFSNLSADDITNGWGLVSNPQGAQYNLFCPTEWGDGGTSDSYFKQTDAQITLIGIGIGVGNFDMSTVANATGTNSFQLEGCVVIGVGAVANWDLSDINGDIVEIASTQFVDNGTFLFPVTGGTSRFCNDSQFVNCGQVNPSTMEFLRNTFVGTTDANGALLGNSSLDSMTFISDDTGHAIYITTPGTYDYTLNSFTGYGADTTTDAVIYNNSGGLVTINVNSGETPTFRNGAGATTTIVSGAVTIQATAALKDGTPVENARVYLKASDGTGPFPFEDIVTITRAGTVATVAHTAHGMATGDKVTILGIQNKTEDRGIHIITVTGVNAYTFVTTDSGATNYTGTIKSTFVALSGLTNVSGVLSVSRVYPSTQPITGWTRKSSSSPFLQEGVLVGNVSNLTGFIGTAVMLEDE